jgi:hypothetical protein
VLDASVLVELAYGTKVGEAIKTLLEESDKAFTTQLSLTELFYILCRKLGAELAEKKITDLIESGYITPEQPRSLIYEVGKIKCKRAISLADCYIIALAKEVGGKAVFARKEREIEKEMMKEVFEVEFVFGDELIGQK